MKVHQIKSIFGVMLGALSLSSVVVVCTNVSATSSSTTASVTVTAACTLSGANHNYYDTISGGETKTFGPSSIKATCNDTAGYSLYAIGFSGDSYSGNNTKMIGTNTNIDTATSGNTSRWSMQVASVPGTYAPTIMNSFDSAHVIPADYAQIAKYTSLTDGGDNAEGSNLQVSYTVSISPTQAVDTYTGKVKYTLVHPNDATAPVQPLPDSACPARSICYAPNNGDIDGSMSSMGSVTGSDTAGRQSSVGTNSTAVLRAPNFSRDGYGFAGWSTDFEATSTSKVYGPNETITTSTTAGSGDADVSQHGLILYPVWIASSGNLQGWTGCSGLTQAPAPSTGNRATLSSMTALTDERDDNVYAVARLADGNCWMAENLRLDADYSANASLAQGFGNDTANNRGKFIGLADSEDANFTYSSSATDPTNANSLYYAGTQEGTATMNIGQINYAGNRIPRYNNNNTKLASGATNSAGVALTDSYNANNDHVRWYGYGNYYNWPAAIANTTYVDTNNQPVTNTSICPTGWRLPQGGNKTRIESDNDNDFWNLVVDNLKNNVLPANYNSSTQPYYGGSTEATPVSNLVRAFPNNFLYSGYFSTSSAYSRGIDGRYWSSSAYSNTSVYYFYFASTSVIPGTSTNDKSGARTVRCILDSNP